jgi:hypothetical protein
VWIRISNGLASSMALRHKLIIMFNLEQEVWDLGN